MPRVDLVGSAGKWVGLRTPTTSPHMICMFLAYEGRYKATWKREFKLPWREAGPLNHHDDIVDSDQ